MWVSKKNGECGAQIPVGARGGRVSEHVARVESLREMGREVLRYRKEGGAIEYRNGEGAIE